MYFVLFLLRQINFKDECELKATKFELPENLSHVSSSSRRVNINGGVVDAVLDTTAEITIIFQRVYKSLKP